MTRKVFHLLPLLLFWLSQLTAAQASLDANPSLEERAFTASKVYSLLQSRSFPVPKTSTDTLDEFDGFYKNYLHSILATQDRRQFDLATIEFVAGFHNGHTFFWDTWLDDSNNKPLGFYAIPLEGHWVVQSSFIDSLKPGDILSKLDDMTMEAFFLQQQRYISASSTAARRCDLFLFPYLFPEEFTLTLEDGRQFVVNRANLKKPQERTEGRWIQKRLTAYIRIPTFFDPSFEDGALSLVRQFHHARTLIVDLRNNPGGIPPERLIAALMDRPYRRWAASTCIRRTPISEADQEANSREFSPETVNAGGVSNDPANPCRNTELIQSYKSVDPTPGAFRGRLVFLLNGGCISACEDLIEPSKESGRELPPSVIISRMGQNSKV